MTFLRAQFLRPGFRPINGKRWFTRQDHWTDGITFALDPYPLRFEFPVSRRPEYWPDAPACRQCICDKKRRKKK